jgi:signal transduction histidine kinase
MHSIYHKWRIVRFPIETRVTNLSIPIEKSPTRGLLKAWHYVRFGWPTIALVALIALGGYFLMLDTARDQDRAYIQSTRDFVRESTHELTNKNAVVSTDYALWSDAYENITLNDNQQWMADNFFSTNVTTLSVLRPGRGIRFSSVKDNDEKLKAAIPKILPSLDLSDFTEYEKNPIQTNVKMPTKRVVMLNGAVFSLALQPIRPYDTFTGTKPTAGKPIDYIIAMKALDQDAITAIGKSFALSKPTLTVGDQSAQIDASRISYSLKDNNLKTLAVISWDNLRPGTVAMNERLLPVSLALIAIMILTIIITHRSVASRMRLFKAARDAAETANRVKSNFLASVSHELRTPLSGIIGYAEMIEEDARDEGNTVTARDAKKVTNSAHHLLSVINDLLDHTKIEAGKMDLNPTQADITPILASVVENLQHQVTKKKTKLTLVADPLLGQANIDAMRLKQCLFNLVSNAAKFTKDGTIVVSARPVDHKGVAFIRIAVKDSGIGMSETTIAKLFKPFTQADESTAAKFGGTGLGLSITKALVEAMGGTISVESMEGEGSTFTMLVPQGMSMATSKSATAPSASLAA